MNTRCHYCGWSFSLSRDALEAAVSTALAANEKMHVEHCPHCRRVIKLAVAQLRRALPANWTPPSVDAAATAPAAEPVAEAVPATAPSESAEVGADKPKRRRRGPPAETTAEAAEVEAEAPQAVPPKGKTAAEPSAAKKTVRKQSKP